jgi:hypothetical protein
MSRTKCKKKLSGATLKVCFWQKHRNNAFFSLSCQGSQWSHARLRPGTSPRPLARLHTHTCFSAISTKNRFFGKKREKGHFDVVNWKLTLWKQNPLLLMPFFDFQQRNNLSDRSYKIISWLQGNCHFFTRPWRLCRMAPPRSLTHVCDSRSAW